VSAPLPTHVTLSVLVLEMLLNPPGQAGARATVGASREATSALPVAPEVAAFDAARAGRELSEAGHQ
jgi:hypothetical protein